MEKNLHVVCDLCKVSFFMTLHDCFKILYVVLLVQFLFVDVCIRAKKIACIQMALLKISEGRNSD